MEIGIGLPTAVAGTTGEQLVEFAKRADRRRVLEPRHARPDRLPELRADRRAGGRGGGHRADQARDRDPDRAAARERRAPGKAGRDASIGSRAAGWSWASRPAGARTTPPSPGSTSARAARVFDRMLSDIRRAWTESAGDYDVGPDVSADPPPLIIGGAVQRTFERAAEHGDGWIMGGGTPDAFAEGRERMERPGAPPGARASRAACRSPTSPSARTPTRPPSTT